MYNKSYKFQSLTANSEYAFAFVQAAVILIAATFDFRELQECVGFDLSGTEKNYSHSSAGPDFLFKKPLTMS